VRYTLRIILAKDRGFCFGVKQAIDLVLQTLKDEAGPVYTIGPLIHNPQVVESLKGKGLRMAINLSGLKQGVLVIRSHGMAKETIEEARQRGLRIVNATCPYVTKAQKLASSLEREGYKVVIIGDKDHPEVKSMTSPQRMVIQEPGDIDRIPRIKRMGIVSQTTQNPENFQLMAERLAAKASELKIYNTICQATRARQASTRDLARRSDLMIVVGGYNSANTACLAQICEAVGVQTHHIEKAKEIDLRWLSDKERIGISGGTSTPKESFQEVREWLKKAATKCSRT